MFPWKNFFGWIPLQRLSTFSAQLKQVLAGKLLTLLSLSQLAEQNSDTGPVQVLMNKDVNLEYLLYLWEP